jgi:hypothetical protein
VAIIPLHSLSVVDVAANDMKDNEILAHALANVSHAERQKVGLLEEAAISLTNILGEMWKAHFMTDQARILTIFWRVFLACFPMA